MGISSARSWLAISVIVVAVLSVSVMSRSDDVFYEWHVAIAGADEQIKSVSVDQPVITINGMFPGPLVNCTTNDVVYINVFNHMDEPLLITWNGIQQRLNSWQDGVSGTNCPILPGMNWTYVFQPKDQIGTFNYFPSTNFHKAGGGFGPIRVNNRHVIPVPFPTPESEFDLLIGDWYNHSFMDVRSNLKLSVWAYGNPPQMMLINGKGPYMHPSTKPYESFNVTKGKTYKLRISNVGTTWSFNFRVQDHQMVVVETEGSYTEKITVDSLDVHVGQSYSVLLTADQPVGDYFIVASPKLVNATDNSTLVGTGVLHYDMSTTPPIGPLPKGPQPFDIQFSMSQATLIRWNLTAGAARPNPQGSFNVNNVEPSQFFHIQGSTANVTIVVAAEETTIPRYVVNNVSYLTPATPLKLADHFNASFGVYELDEFPANSTTIDPPIVGTFVATGIHKAWLEIVFQNLLKDIDTWHLDGYGFFVVGFGLGEWTENCRADYNTNNPVVRSTIQVYPAGWTAVYVYLDNPGMWNLRSEKLRNWYLGEELYIRVDDTDPNPAKERPPPTNLLFCGSIERPFSPLTSTPSPSPNTPKGSSPTSPTPLMT